MVNKNPPIVKKTKVRGKYKKCPPIPFHKRSWLEG
jgi:hypothetical protein